MMHMISPFRQIYKFRFAIFTGIILSVLIIWFFGVQHPVVGVPIDSNVPVAFAASQDPVVPLGIDITDSRNSVNIQTDELDIRDPDNEPVDGKFDVELVTNKENGEYSLSFSSKENGMRPGRYHVSGTVETATGVRDFSQDFYWGVLAINTNKSIYTPGEQADVALAVLDERGLMVCDAAVTLYIRDEKNILQTLTTEHKDIRVNDECIQKTKTYRPDYETEFIVGKPGMYTMTLVAETKNGTYQVVDSFEVRESVPFDVERVTATRVYPAYPYEVKFNITAHQDFNGTIEERVPSEFEILQPHQGYQYREVRDDVDAATGLKHKVIAWDVSLNKNDSFEIVYSYDAPDISPEFYLLGPLVFRSGDVVFQETRQWQIANDAVAFDAVTESHTGTTGASATYSWSHTPVGTPKAVVVFTIDLTGGNYPYGGVTYGGVALSEVTSGTASDGSGTPEGGTMKAWFLGSGIPTGTQTVQVTESGSMNNNHAYVYTFTAGGDTSYAGVYTESNNQTLTEENIDDGSPGTSSIRVMAVKSGASSVLSAGSNSTYNGTGMSIDGGSTISMTVYETVPGQGSRPVGVTYGTSDDVAAVYLAVIETNSAPTITTATDSPDPVVVGDNTTFSVDWNDTDGDNVKVKICKTDSLTNQNCDGGSWATSTSFTASDPEAVTYTAQSGDVAGSPQDYYAFVCDTNATCSSSSSGTFSVNNSLSITSVYDTPDPANPGRSVTWVIDWAGGYGSVKAKVCSGSSGLSNQNCTSGTTWATSSDFSTQDPLHIWYEVQAGDAATSPNNYYVYICDTSATCTTVSSGDFSVNTHSTIPNVKFR